MHQWIILFVTAFSLDIILKFSKTVISEFSDFFVQKNSRSGDASPKCFRWPPNWSAIVFTWPVMIHAHSRKLFTGHLYDACAKTSDIVLIKIMKSAGAEIRIAFLICYLQSLYGIELGHYFWPKFVGHVTNQKILVDAVKRMQTNTVMAIQCMRMEIIFTNFEWQLQEIWA